jgi:hypothetical protein
VLSLAAFGCKKKDDGAAATTGSGSAAPSMAAGSGSAPAMAAGSGSAAPAMAGSGSAAPATGVAALECGAAIDHALNLEKDAMKKEMPAMSDADFTKLRDAAVQLCKDDKWPDVALHCFADGKTEAEVDKCDEKLPPDLKEKFNKGMEAAMTVAMGSGSGAAPAAAAELPKECADYKASIDKLAKCDKMPAATKDGFEKGFKAMSEGWTNLGALPPDAVKAMETGCKQSAEALMKAAKTVCGW